MINTRYNSQLGQTIESLTSETHALLQLLTDWSSGDVTKPQIYDGYLNLAMAFIACSYAFEENGIDMSTARIAPQQIFDQLERMLSMDAAPQARETYLPSIQSSVQLLLQDLRAKRRESYQLSRTRKRKSLDSNASSTTNTVVEMEREKTLQCLNGQGAYRDSGTQYSEVVVSPRRSDSSNTSITKFSESSSSSTLDGLACDHGEKYICGACGTVCIEPIQDVVDSLTSTSLELKSLLEKWRVDPALAVNLYLSCMRVSQDYDAAVEVFSNKGAYIADLDPVVQELKTAVSKATRFPYRCGHDDLRNRIMLEACSSVEQLNRGLRSRQRRYMLKHAPAIKPSVTHLLSCLKKLGEALARWNHGKIHRGRVEYAYAVLDGAFKVVVSAFYAHGVDVSDLIKYSSNELSTTLQSILAEEPSPENWKKHQPALGAVVKNLLKAVLDKNTDDYLVVEVWWSVVLLDGSEEVDAVEVTSTTAHNSSLAEKHVTFVPPQTPALAPTLGHNPRAVYIGTMPVCISELDVKRATPSVAILPAPAVRRIEPVVDLLADSIPFGPVRGSQKKGGALGSTLHRMSGRISSMFNLRDIKTGGRYRRLPA